MILAELNNFLYCYLSFVCFTSAIKVPTEWTRNSAKLLANYDEKLAGETRNRDTIDKGVKLNIKWPQYSENLQKQQPKTNFDDVEIINPEFLKNKYQQNYFQYTAPKPQFAVQVAQFHGVPNPRQQYEATPVQPHTLHPKPSIAASAIHQNPNPVFEPFNKFVAAQEQLKAPLSPISSNYEIFHPYKAERPYLRQLSKDPAYRKVKQDVKANGKRLKQYEKTAGNVDVPKENYLKSPEQIDDDKFGNDGNTPTEFEKYSAEKKPIYYERPKKQNIPHEYLNQKLKYPIPHNYAKTKPVHYAPLRHHILNLKQQQVVRFGDENDQYPEIKPRNNHFAEPPDGYDIYEKEKQNYENLNQNFNKDFNAFAAGQGSDGPTHRTASRNEQHQDYKNYAPSKDIEEDFVPIKMYAQVRKTETTKHLPREEAYNEAETPDEILNAPRLREAVKSTKAQTVYTEEGYEDSAYDHAGHQKHASNEEGHGGYLKNNEQSAGKYKVPSVSGGHEDGGGSSVGHSVSSGKKWKDLDEDSVEHDDTETLNEDEREISESQNFDLNEAGSENKFIEAPTKPKTSLSMTKDSEKTTIKEANDGMLVSTKSQHLRLSNDKNLAGDREYTELPTVQGKVKNSKPIEETQERRESITKMTKVLPNDDIERSKRGVEFEVPSFSLKNTFLTEDDILAISKQKIGVKEDFNPIKYPYYNSKIIDRNSPLRYAENVKNIPTKSKGGTEFYDSRSYVECPEVEPIIDPVPERIRSLPDNKKENPEDGEEDGQADDNESNMSEVGQNQSDADFSSIKKQPRLRGLGDSIDCFKAKYFDENPLDSPFFKEDVIEDPEPLILPPIPQAENQSQPEEMKSSSSHEVMVVQPADSIEIADLNKPAESAKLTEAIEQTDTAKSSKNTENSNRSEKYVNPSYLDLVLKVITHKLGYIPKDLHKRVYRDLNGQQHGRDLKDILRNYYTLSDKDDGYQSQQIRASNAQDDEDDHESIDSLNDEDDEYLSKSPRYTNRNYEEPPAENIHTTTDDDDGHLSKFVRTSNGESNKNEDTSNDENDEDGEYENKKDRSTQGEEDSGIKQNVRSSDDDNDEFVAKYVNPSSYEYHEHLNKNLHSANDDNDNNATKQKHQAEAEDEKLNTNIRPSNNEHQEDFNKRIHSSNDDREEYKTANTRKINDEDESINKNSRPINDEDFENFYEKIRSWHNEGHDNIRQKGHDNITNDRGTSHVDDIDNINQNIDESKDKTSEYINSNDQKSNSENDEDTNQNTRASNSDDNKKFNENIRPSDGDDDEAAYQKLRTFTKEEKEDIDHNVRTLEKEDDDNINQNIRTFNNNDGEGVKYNAHTSNLEDNEDVNQNIPTTNDEDVNQNVRFPNSEDEETKKESILANDDYDEPISKNITDTKDNDSIKQNIRLPNTENNEELYENIHLSKQKDDDELNEYLYSPNLEDFDDFENFIPINTPSDDTTDEKENIYALSENGNKDKEILSNNGEKSEKVISKDNPSEKNTSAKQPSYLNLVLKVLSPDIDFRSLSTYSDIIENIRVSKNTVKENKRLLTQNSDSTAFATNADNKEDTTQLPKIIRRKRSTDFKYEPYKVIENYQMDTKNKMKQTTISPLLKRMLSTRVNNVDKTHVVKRDTMFKPYKYIDKTHRRAARGHVEPVEESLVMVDIDPRRGEPRYEVLTPANHKSQYTPVTFKKSISVEEDKAGRSNKEEEVDEEEEEDEEEKEVEEEEEEEKEEPSNKNLEYTNYDEPKKVIEPKDIDRNEKNSNRGHSQKTSTTVNPVFDVNNYLPTIRPNRRRGNSTKIRKHNNIISKITNPSSYVKLATLQTPPNPTTQDPQNELQVIENKDQRTEELQEPIIEYSDYEVDDEPKTTERPLPKKRVILIKHTSTRAPQKYIDYSDYEEADDITSTTTEIPRVKIRIRNKKDESIPVKHNNQKHSEVAEEEENQHLDTNEEEEEDTHEDTPVTPDYQDLPIEQENATEEIDPESDEKIPLQIKNNANENENEADDELHNESPKIFEKSSKKRKNNIRTKSKHYENDAPDQTTKEIINEMMGNDQKLQQFAPPEKEIVQITSRKAPSGTTTRKSENTDSENTSRMILPSRPKNRRRRIKIRRKPQIQELNHYDENSEDEKLLDQTKPQAIKSERLQLFRDKELAKNVNDLEDKSVSEPETLPDSEVEIFRDDFQMNDGPRHGGNYRIAPEIEDTKKTRDNLELREDDEGLDGTIKKMHGGNLKRNHDGQIERSAEVLNGFASAMPILTTTPIYIEDPAERMYYFVDS